MRATMGARVAGRIGALFCGSAAHLVGFACAVVLFSAYWVQRTEWRQLGGRRGNRLFVLPDPSPWNLLVSVCGIAAIVALLLGLWSPRWAARAAFGAAAAFGLAAPTAWTYRIGVSPETVLPGHPALGSGWTFHPASAPLTLTVIALVGIAAALIVAVAARWGRGATAGQRQDEGWPRGNGSTGSWIDRAAGLGRTRGGAPVWRESTRAVGIRTGADGIGEEALAVGIACAVVLLPAMVAPPAWARTSWIGRNSSITDSPAGYVWLVSLMGLAALVALVIAARSMRFRVVAALAACAAFGYAACATVVYAVLVWRGIMEVEGHLDLSGPSPDEVIAAPELLPFFVLVAVFGAVSSLGCAVTWWPPIGAPRGPGSSLPISADRETGTARPAA